LIERDTGLYEFGDQIVRPAIEPIRIAETRTVPGLRLIPVGVTFFDDYTAKNKRQQLVPVDDLTAMLRDTSAPEKSALPWLKLARFGNAKTDRGSLRHDRNVIAISGVEADYDGGEVPFDDAVDIAAKAGLLAILYTSPSHTPERPR
jgi:hypothetical protein